MILSAGIPQDIVDDVIGCLFDHPEALKTCSLVSRSFYHIARRRLFSRISLHAPHHAECLERLLSANPEISNFVLDLRFSPGDTEPHNPRFLTSLKRIRHLGIGRSESTVYWNFCSVETKATIAALLRFPSLESLELINTQGIPLSILRSITQLKTLRMGFVSSVDDIDLEVAPLMQLESIHFSLSVGVAPSLFSNTPYLRQISVEGRNVSGIRSIIDAGAKQIEDLIWRGYIGSPGSSHFSRVESQLDLGGLRNLRRLSCIIDNYYSLTGGGWLPIGEALGSPAVRRSLEEFNFVIRVGRINSTKVTKCIGCSIGESSWWKDFDSLLGDPVSGYARLQKVQIYLDVGTISSSFDEHHFIGSFRNQLPWLVGAGLLDVIICTDFDWQSLL